jgi:hypothetical protein
MAINKAVVPVVNEIFKRTREFEAQENAKPAAEQLDIGEYMKRVEEIVATVWIQLRDHPEHFQPTETLETGPSTELLKWYVVQPVLNEAEYLSDCLAIIEETNIGILPSDLHANFRKVTNWMIGHANRVGYVRWLYSGMPSTRGKAHKQEKWSTCKCGAFDFCREYSKGLICLDCYSGVNRHS